MSGNAKGRPKRGQSLAERVRLKTDDGQALVDFAWEVFKAPGSDDEARRWAHGWLSDRGHGKPLAAIELSAAPPDDDAGEDLSLLSVAQLRELERLEGEREQILAAARALALPPADDAEPTPTGLGPGVVETE